MVNAFYGLLLTGQSVVGTLRLTSAKSRCSVRSRRSIATMRRRRWSTCGACGAVSELISYNDEPSSVLAVSAANLLNPVFSVRKLQTLLPTCVAL